MKHRRRPFEVFSLSFLDVVSCGFGAIVLLLIMVKISDPTQVKDELRLAGEIEDFRQQIVEMKKQSSDLEEMIADAEKHTFNLGQQVENLKKTLADKSALAKEIRLQHTSTTTIISRLFQARQELNEEIRRLHSIQPPDADHSLIGGIPVDSEYIIFIIDTSGSMQQSAWPAVRSKMKEILEIYPYVKGIQVMNDMGDYMFSQYSGKWIRDTPARRKSILDRLASWTPFSNSSPEEGVTAAIRRFHAVDKKISLYIFGDDFSRGSIQQVVDTVNSINRSAGSGGKHVRIHAVGFPVLFDQPGAELNISRFAALMRRLAEDNNGSFVGLTRLQ